MWDCAFGQESGVEVFESHWLKALVFSMASMGIGFGGYYCE